MASIVSKDILRRVYPQRSPGAHKGDFGHLLIIGGSVRYTGAPGLVALAALRAGVDRVTVIAPRRSADVVANLAPEIATVPLEGDILTPIHGEVLRQEQEGKTALAIGPGLGRGEETLQAVRAFLSDGTMPAAIDADAIHAVAGDLADLRSRPVVVTPHAKEFEVLTGESLDDVVPSHRPSAVEKQAARLGVSILLKGHHDIISDGSHTFTNETGTPLMTVGGTGDVLAGVVGALLARGIGALTVACAAALVVGRAGEIAGEAKGEGMMAGDVVDAIPAAIASF